MKRYYPIAVLLLTAIYFSVTGFQCGSAETTSAKLYMQQKQWQKAEESLLKELAKNDKNEEAWYLLGQVRIELKNYQGMNDAFTRALQISDAHKPEISRNRLAIWAMLYNEGISYYNKGKDDPANYDKAVEDFNTAIAVVPDSSATYYVSALAYYAKKDNKNAKARLETALEKKPEFADAARFLGQLHYTAGMERIDAKDSVGASKEFDASMKAFETAYAAEPSNADNISNLIEIYDRTQNHSKALSLTSSAVEKDPSNKIYRYAYGVFLLKQDKYPEAIEQFKKAVELDPTYGDAIYNLGVAYLNWGVSMKAETDKKAETAREKMGSKAKDVKADLSYKDKLKDSLPYLEKASEIRPDDAALWQQLGRVYANLNMVDKSKAAFERFDKLTKSK
jgi:tetratricopeptide (TPR) repeat protein